MAIDVGTKRIGIAVSDKSRLIATPKTSINRVSNLVDFTKIKELILENDIKGIIVGLPLNMDDSENEMTIFARNFAKNLDVFLNGQYPNKTGFFEGFLGEKFCEQESVQRSTCSRAKLLNDKITKKDWNCLDIGICLHDERLTSFMVKNDIAQMITGKTRKKKQVIDQMAASLILQDVLNSNNQ